MPPLEDFLRRFRPLVAPPGVAGPVSVPTDRSSDLLAEVADVLSAIERVEDEVARLELTARSEAEAHLSAGRAEAARITAQASARAPAERAAGYAERHEAGEDAIRREVEAADREAERIRQVAAERMPALTDAVLQRLFGVPRAAE